jgi:APA family basic amino acid/polyamine antiporter
METKGIETTKAAKAGTTVATFGGLFRIKSLDSILKAADEPEHQLRRALGPVQLTLFGIGAIIGAGIFATIGTAAAGDQYRPGAGPALMLSFVITAVVCSFTALCYAEFASMVPISGSAYTYSYATLGEVVAWIIGWDLIIEYAVGNIAVAISWANYFKKLLESLNFKVFGHVYNLSVKVPDWISTDYRTAVQKGITVDAPHPFGFPIVFNLLAVSIVAAITVILIWGVRESARFNAVMVGIKILVLTFFIIIGFTWVNPGNWTPFSPNGWSGISAGAAIVFFAYIGFDAVSTVAEETRNPQRNLPIGIISSLIICTVFYVVVSAVFTGLISYPELKGTLSNEQAEPLTLALEHASPNLGWAVGIVAFGSVVAHTAVLLVYQLGQPRIFFSMARDGLLPPVFYRVHKRFRTPHISTIITGIFVASFAAIASIDEMVDLTNIGTLFAFILVCVGIIVLRVKDPQRARPFRVPSGWRWTILLYAVFAFGVMYLPLSSPGKAAILVASAIVFAVSRNYIFPVLGILGCLYLVYYLPSTSWLRFTAWLNLGFVIYVGYGAVNSQLSGRKASEEPAEHNARTAYSGAVLAILGVGSLFFMRGVEAWLTALDSHRDLSLLAKTGAALGDVLRPGPWLELSWFLVVPLALNAFLLCPIILRRALKARAGPDSRKFELLTSRSVAIAALIVSGSLLYLALVVSKNWAPH